MTTYTTALEWVKEWMEANKPEFKSIEGGFWDNGVVNYLLYEEDLGEVVFEKFTTICGFRFKVPATKEEFFTVLNILEK